MVWSSYGKSSDSLIFNIFAHAFLKLPVGSCKPFSTLERYDGEQLSILASSYCLILFSFLTLQSLFLKLLFIFSTFFPSIFSGKSCLMGIFKCLAQAFLNCSVGSCVPLSTLHRYEGDTLRALAISYCFIFFFLLK